MTINDIIAANYKVRQYFFSPENMRFFGSIIEETVYEGPGGVYFVTSERRPGGRDPRRYTARQFDPQTAHVTTVGPFATLTRVSAHVKAAWCSQAGTSD